MKGLAKTDRAELHERFADWFEDGGRDVVELDELLGYHLEQAARWKQELGQPDPALADARARGSRPAVAAPSGAATERGRRPAARAGR